MTKRQITDKIPFKLLAVFGLLAAIILTGGWLFYQNQRAATTRHIQNDLNIVTQLKSNEITAWRRERYGNAYTMSQSAIFIGMVKKWLGRPADAVLRQQIYGHLESFKAFGNYEGIYLTDAAGRIRLFTSKEIIGKLGARSLELIKLAADSNKIIFSDFYHCPECGHDHLDVFAPMFQGKDYIGCLIFRINPHVFLYPLIRSWPDENKTAETLLLHLHRQENRVHILNEPRHVQKKDIHKILSTADTMLVEIKAGQGQTGLVKGLDYRGIPVVAVVKPIAGSPWYMVSKMDEKEIYAPLRRQAISTALIIFLLLGTAGLSVGAMWQAERRDHYKKQYHLELEKMALIKHYDHLTKYANDIIFLLDQDRRIVEINERGLETYGYAKEELLGREAGIIRAEEQREEFRTQMEELKAKGALLYETMHRKKDGTSFPVEISARTIEIEGKKYLQGIARDITERKQFELKIQDRNEELEAANEQLMANEEELKATEEDLRKQNEELVASEQQLTAADEELRQQFEELQKSQAELQAEKIWSDTLIQFAPNIVIGLGEGSKILLFNRYAEKLTGYQAEEVLGKKWIDLVIPAEQRPQLYKIFEDIVASRHKDHSYRNPIVTKDGRTRMIAWSNTAMAEQGEFKMVLSIGQDITERLKAEEALKENEEKYRLVFEAANVGKSTTLPGGEIQANKALCSMLGYSCEEMKTKKWQDITPPEDIDDIQLRLDSIIKGEKDSDRFEKRYTCKDRSIIWTDVSVAARRDSQGKLMNFITTVVDITERKKAEEVIRQAVQKWSVTFDAITDGVAILDREQNILQINLNFSRLMGRPYSEIIGHKCYELVHADGKPDENCPFDKMLKSRKREDMELTIGDAIFNVIVDPIIDPSGEVTGAVHIISDITERKQAEEEIKVKRDYLQKLQNAMADAIFVVTTPERNIEYVNGAVVQIFGYETAECLGRNTLFFYADEEGYLEFGRKLEEAMKNNKSIFHAEHLLKRKTGETLVAEITTTFIRGADGSAKIISIVHDITQRKLAEKIIRENEQNLRDLVENLFDGVAIVDENAKHLFVNSKFTEITGYSREELLNLTGWDLTRPEDRAALQQRMKDRIEGRPHLTQYERIFLRKDGTEIPAEMSTSTTNWQGIKRPLAVIHDISERKKAEQKIRSSEIRYRRLFESAKDGILILNADTGVIDDANPFIKELLGYPREELIGKELWEIGLFKDIVASRDSFMELKKKGYVRYEDLPLESKDGHKKDVEFVSNVYPVGDHNVVQCNIRDITQRVQAEEIIRASLREKEVMLKEIHHRVKNNLQIIASLLNLQTGYVDDPRYKKMFLESQSRVRSMALVHETLYESKDLSGIDFSHYVKSLMYDLYQAYGVTQGQVALSLDITGEKLPLDIAIPCGLIVNELATNSFKYAFKDRKGPGRMDISLNRDDAGTYTLEVSDNGPGISQDLNLKTVPTLGLQLVDSLVGQLDASIRITGEGGTKVTIKFKVQS